MKRRFLPILLLVLGVVFFLSPVFSDETAPLGDVHPLFLWKTSNGDSNIYLAGSIHVLSTDFYPLPEPFETALSDSENLILEALTDNESQQNISALMMEYGLYLDGSTLADHIPQETYAGVVSMAESFGIEEQSIAVMRPWMAAITLQILRMSRLGFNSSAGMETIIGTRFSADRKAELEGSEFQLKLMYSLSDGEKLLLLKSALNQHNDLRVLMDEIIGAWKLGDETWLDSLLVTQNGSSSSIMRRLIIDRNYNMTRNILTMSDGSDESWFVLVGAAHMMGDEGIPALLQEAGLEVFRCDSSGNYIPISP